MKKNICLLCMAFCLQTFAYDLSHKFGVGVGGGYPIPVFSNQFNDLANPKWSAEIYGRYHFTSATGIDLGVSEEAFKNTSMKFQNINALFFWRTAGAAKITPVLGIGAAATKITNYTLQNTKLSGLARLGGEFGFTPSLALDALVDYQYVSKVWGKMPTNPAHVITPKLTLTWYFGAGSENVGMKKEEANKMVTEAVKKEEVKKETKEEVVEEGPVVVSAAAPQRIEKMEMNFEFDSNKIEVKSRYQEELKKAAEHLKQNPELKATIKGYADSTGPKKLNETISKQRAEAIREKLIEYGVAAERLNTAAFGDKQPTASNETQEGRQKNRRVYLEVAPE